MSVKEWRRKSKKLETYYLLVVTPYLITIKRWCSFQTEVSIQRALSTRRSSIYKRKIKLQNSQCNEVLDYLQETWISQLILTKQLPPGMMQETSRKHSISCHQNCQRLALRREGTTRLQTCLCNTIKKGDWNRTSYYRPVCLNSVRGWCYDNEIRLRFQVTNCQPNIKMGFEMKDRISWIYWNSLVFF